MRMKGVVMPCMLVMGFTAMVMLMPVVPQLRLVQQEEEHQPDQQSHEQIFGTRLTLERLRQQMHECSGQQSACRQAQHVLGVTRQHAKAQ